jgi:hypothetical protein
MRWSIGKPFRSQFHKERTPFSCRPVITLAGARAVLLSVACYDMMQTVADKAEYIDLSKSPDFSTVFAESMRFPQ